LVDVILSAGGDLKIVEVPYRFRERNAGESKLTPLVGIDFLGLVVLREPFQYDLSCSRRLGQAVLSSIL
jgi:hypothetical protein